MALVTVTVGITGSVGATSISTRRRFFFFWCLGSLLATAAVPAESLRCGHEATICPDTPGLSLAPVKSIEIPPSSLACSSQVSESCAAVSAHVSTPALVRCSLSCAEWETVHGISPRSAEHSSHVDDSPLLTKLQLSHRQPCRRPLDALSSSTVHATCMSIADGSSFAATDAGAMSDLALASSPPVPVAVLSVASIQLCRPPAEK